MPNYKLNSRSEKGRGGPHIFWMDESFYSGAISDASGGRSLCESGHGPRAGGVSSLAEAVLSCERGESSATHNYSMNVLVRADLLTSANE